MKENSIGKYLAKGIRIITVPPVLTGILIVLLATRENRVFASPAEVVISLCFLVVIPVLAYPISVTASMRNLGRAGQRELAMWLSCIGYFLAVVYGFAGNRSKDLKFIYLVYQTSVFLLLLSNKIIHLKASGHACSLTGPVVIGCYYFKWPALLVGCAAYIIVFWSSIKTGRHSFKELVTGSMLCVLACILSWTCIFI